MPEIRIFGDPWEETPYEGHDPTPFEDLGFAPERPVQDEEPELTPQERRESGFTGEAYSGPRLGGFQHPGYEPEIPRGDLGAKQHKPLYLLRQPEYGVTGVNEVCVYAGWPRRHIRAGAHCPHGHGSQDEQP